MVKPGKSVSIRNINEEEDRDDEEQVVALETEDQEEVVRTIKHFNPFFFKFLFSQKILLR